MSRAIRILKPVQDEKDLQETTRRFFGSDRLGANELASLAKAYTVYQRSQPTTNFHGLRDYYALVKGLSGSGDLTPAIMRNSIARNFGGGEVSSESLYKWFFSNAQRQHSHGDLASFPTALESIKANLEEPWTERQDTLLWSVCPLFFFFFFFG
jgi:hypothetical protein